MFVKVGEFRVHEGLYFYIYHISHRYRAKFLSPAKIYLFDARFKSYDPYDKIVQHLVSIQKIKEVIYVIFSKSVLGNLDPYSGTLNLTRTCLCTQVPIRIFSEKQMAAKFQCLLTDYSLLCEVTINSICKCFVFFWTRICV